MKLSLPHYFSRRLSLQIEELYAATAIGDLGVSIMLLFEPIFLFTVLNFTIQQVLWYYALVYFCYALFIPIGARIVSVSGYYHGIFYGTFFMIGYWLLLYNSTYYNYLIWLAPVVLAMYKSLYWPAFHASISRFAGQHQKGREFSALYAIVNLTRIAGPFIGGLVGSYYGLQGSLLLASVIYFCSFIPLFIRKEEFVPKPYQFKWTLEMYKKYPKKFLGYLGFGEELIVLTIWPIFIYTVVKTFEGTGLLATLSTLVATVLALYLGKVTDTKSKGMLIKIGAFMTSLVYLARFMVNGYTSIFAVDALSRTSKDIVFIPLSAVTYERAESTHIMPYVVFFEQSLAIGKLLACLLGIILFGMTGSFLAVFLLAAIFSLLYMLI